MKALIVIRNGNKVGVIPTMGYPDMQDETNDNALMWNQDAIVIYESHLRDLQAFPLHESLIALEEGTEIEVEIQYQVWGSSPFGDIWLETHKSEFDLLPPSQRRIILIPADQQTISIPLKERCKYEKMVIEYFGLPQDVSFNKVPKVDYADLVSLLAFADERFSQPASLPVDADAKTICVFCEMTCDPAPTTYGWSSVRAGKGLHFDCANRVVAQARAITNLEAVDAEQAAKAYAMRKSFMFNGYTSQIAEAAFLAGCHHVQGVDVERVKNLIGSVKKNVHKIDKGLWKIYKDQILEHLEEIETIL